MTHNFRQFTASQVEATRKAWEDEAKHDSSIFPGDVARTFAFVQSSYDVDRQQANEHAYGIFGDNSTEVADCIVQMAVTKQGRKYVKMLDCIPRPSIVSKALKNDSEAVDNLIDIYIATILGTLHVGGRHKAELIKVYGRTERLLIVLTVIAKKLSEEPEAASIANASVQGRWLVVKPI